MGVDMKMLLDKMRVGIESMNVEVIGETDNAVIKHMRK